VLFLLAIGATVTHIRITVLQLNPQQIAGNHFFMEALMHLTI
jgi:hypothetical protein